MTGTVSLCTGDVKVNLTPAMKAILEQQEIKEDKDDDPIVEEGPLENIGEGKGMIRFLCTVHTSKEITGNGIAGDDRIVWDKRVLDTVKEARTKFYELLKKGYKAFAVRKDGLKSNRRMHKFDPRIEEIIMVAPQIGG